MHQQANICITETKWLAACAALAVGEYCGFRWQGHSGSWPIFLGAAILCALFGFGLSIRGWEYATLLLVGLVLAAQIVERHRSIIRDAHIYSSGRPYCATLTICEDATTTKGRDGKPLTVFPAKIGTFRLKVTAAIPLATSPPKAGETWRCCGWLSGWNESDALHRREFSIRGNRASWVRIEDNSLNEAWDQMLDHIRKSARRRLRLGLENDARSHELLCAMLLGERSSMDKHDKKLFTDAGAMHVFAISGLHVMILARIFVIAALLTLLPLRFAGLLAIPLVWLYVMMVNAPPSAVRAGAMASICLVAPMLWRRPNGIVAWAMAFIATHILNPLQIIDVGSALSFAVMLSLVILIRLCGTTIRRPIIGTIIFSCVAWAAGLPISVRAFGRIAFGGLLAGPIVVPAAMFTTICGAIGIMASFFSEWVAAYSNACAGITLRLMSAICSIIANIPGANIELLPWSFGECIAWYVALCAILWLTLSIKHRHSSLI